jgi:P-type E1-E2 ATPase
METLKTSFITSGHRSSDNLQRRLARLGKSLAMAAVVLIFVVAGLMYLQGAGWKMMFMTAISMAVAAIPEGLPAVVIIAITEVKKLYLRRKQDYTTG